MIKEITINLTVTDPAGSINIAPVRFKLGLPDLTPLEFSTAEEFLNCVNFLAVNIETEDGDLDITDIIDASEGYTTTMIALAELLIPYI